MFDWLDLTKFYRYNYERGNLRLSTNCRAGLINEYSIYSWRLYVTQLINRLART